MKKLWGASPELLGGAANAGFWDYIFSPHGGTMDFDKERVGNALLNFGVGAMASNQAFRKGQVAEGTKTMLLTPAKDLMLLTGMGMPSFIDAAKTYASSPSRDRAKGALMGLGGVGALTLGGLALRHAMKKKEDEGTINVTLPTKDPLDEETKVSLPMSTLALSQSAKDRIGRDVRRRLRSGSKERTRRRDPNTGELLTISEFNQRYNQKAASYGGGAMGGRVAPSPFPGGHRNNPGPETGAEQMVHGPRPINAGPPMVGPMTPWTPQPEMPMEPPPEPPEVPENSFISQRAADLQKRISKMAMVKLAAPWDTARDYWDAAKSYDWANDPDYAGWSGHAYRDLWGPWAGAAPDYAINYVKNQAGNFTDIPRALQSGMDGVGSNLAEAYGGLDTEGNRLGGWDRTKRVGSAVSSGVKGLANTAWQGAEALWGLNPGWGMFGGATEMASNYTKPEAGKGTAGGAPPKFTKTKGKDIYRDTYNTMRGVSQAGGMFVPGLANTGGPTLTGYQPRANSPMDVARQLRMG